MIVSEFSSSTVTTLIWRERQREIFEDSMQRMTNRALIVKPLVEAVILLKVNGQAR